MPLQIRRGTNTQRAGIAFAEGEIIYTIDTKRVFVGDGSTLGGIDIAASANIPPVQGNNGKVLTTDGLTLSWQLPADPGISQISQDSSPSLGGNLSLNSHDITGTGNIDITGNASFSGDLTLTASSTLDLGGEGGMSLYEYTIDTDINPLYIRTSSAEGLVLNAITDGSLIGAAALEINSSRGAIHTPLTTQPGDFVGRLTMSGFNGDSLKPAVSMYSGWMPDANLDDVAPASKFILSIGASGTSSKNVVFNAKGIFAVPILTVASYAGPGAYPSFTNISFAEGSLIFDGQSKNLVTYDGTNWHDILTSGNSALFADGSASHPSIGFTTDGSQDTGLFHPGDGILCIATDAQERVRVDNGGMRVNGFMKVADVNGTLPNPPEAGMIVLDNGTFKGYNGSTWVNLN